MPIYAYRCGACGHAKDVLQRISDPPLDTCPACAARAFVKQLSAPGFQLKGSGWYATDFRNNGAAPAAAPQAGDKAGDKAGSSQASQPAGDSGTAAPAKPAEGGGSAAPTS